MKRYVKQVTKGAHGQLGGNCEQAKVCLNMLEIKPNHADIRETIAALD